MSLSLERLYKWSHLHIKALVDACINNLIRHITNNVNNSQINLLIHESKIFFPISIIFIIQNDCSCFQNRNCHQSSITFTHPCKLFTSTPAKALFLNHNILIIFFYFHEKICCGNSLEVPHWGTSNEFPQHIFYKEIRQIIILTPCHQKLCGLWHFHYTVLEISKF